MVNNTSSGSGANANKQQASSRTKADIIIEKVNCLLSSTNEMIERADKSVQNTALISRQNSEIFEKSLEENAVIKQQIKYIAAQSQTVFDKMAEMITKLSEKVAELEQVVDGQQKFSVDEISDAVLAKINDGQLSNAIKARLNDGELADNIVARINMGSVMEELEDVIAEGLAEEEDEIEEAEGDEKKPVRAVLNYDALADKVAERIAGQITLPEAAGEVDYEKISQIVENTIAGAKTSQSEHIVEKAEIDYEKIAEIFEDKLEKAGTYSGAYSGAPEDTSHKGEFVEEGYIPTYEEVAEFFVEENAVYSDGDEYEEDIEDFGEADIVEEDAHVTYEPIDYDLLAKKIADILPTPETREAPAQEEYKEHKEQAETAPVLVQIDYDVLAEKLASCIPSQEPISADIIAAKVADQLISPEGIVDCEAIANFVADRLLESGDVLAEAEEGEAQEPAEEAYAEEEYEEAEEELIDYEKLSSMVAEKIHISPATIIAEDGKINADELASLIVDKILYEEEPEDIEALDEYEENSEAIEGEADGEIVESEISGGVEIDYEELSSKIAEKMHPAETVDLYLDYDELAQKIADKVHIEPGETLVGDTHINTDELAQKIADKVNKDIYTDIDPEELAAAVAEKLLYIDDAFSEDMPEGEAEEAYAEDMPEDEDEFVEEDLDYEKLATLIAEKITPHLSPEADEETPLDEYYFTEEDLTEDELEEALEDELENERTPAEYAPIDGEKAYAEAYIDLEKLSEIVKGCVYEAMDEHKAVTDYDAIARAVSERLAGDKAEAEAEYEETTDISLDYDTLSEKIADLLKPIEVRDIDMDYDVLAEKIAAKLMHEEEPENVDELEEYEEDIAEIEIDYDELSSKIAEKLTTPEAQDMDYDKLSSMIADKVLYEEEPEDIDSLEEYEEEAIEGEIVEGVEIDYEELSSKIAEKMHPTETVDLAVDYEKLSSMIADKITSEEEPEDIDNLEGYEEYEEDYVEEDLIDYEKLSSMIADKLLYEEEPDDIDGLDEFEEAIDAETVEGEIVEGVEIDYEELSSKIAEKMHPTETVDLAVDYEKLSSMIADKVLYEEEPDDIDSLEEFEEEPQEKEATDGLDIDYEELSSKIAEKIPHELAAVDYDKISEIIRESLEEKYKEAPVAEEDSPESESESESEPVAFDVHLSEDDINAITDEITKRISEIIPSEFDILVNDDGCKEIAKAVSDNIDQGAIADKVAQDVSTLYTLDYEEIASSLSDLITVEANLNEDEIAEKAAAVLSNYLPDIDTDDMCEKIAQAVVSVLPDNMSLDDESVEKIKESILSSLSEAEIVDYGKIDEIVKAGEEEYSIILDDESVDKIAGIVSTEVTKTYEKKLDEITKIDETTVEILGILTSKNYVVSGSDEKVILGEEYAQESAGDEYTEEEPTEEELDLENPIEYGEDEEVEPEEPQEDEYTEEEPTEEELDLENPIEYGEEEPAKEEIGPGSSEVGEKRKEKQKPDYSGVDFISMMRYNRSFIARIIQGTDDVKNFYGRIKTALLSYKKVNSTLSWSSERFNKGRETIARFKIRGKTLCLYLNLNPADFKTSVYHQVDVSGVKSLASTPMMVKIKSPLGVKKAIRLIDILLAERDGVKQAIKERNYVAMYPYESTEELIEDGLIKNVKN